MNITIGYFKGRRGAGGDTPPPPDTDRIFASIGVGVQLSTFQGTVIKEASGLVESRRFPGTLYTHNDSGGLPQTYMVTASSGVTAATISLIGATNLDWEDIAFYSGKIVVYENGSGATPTNRCLYAFTEPTTISSQSVTATKYPISLSTGADKDVETLMIRPSDGVVFIATKSNTGVANTGIFQGPSLDAMSTTSTNVFNRVVDHNPWQVTAGDWLDDGNNYLLSTNGSDPAFPNSGALYVYNTIHAPVGTFIGNASSPVRPPEAACWSADGNWVYRTCDGGGDAGQPIFRYPVVYTTGTVGDTQAAIHSQVVVRSFGVNIQPGRYNYDQTKTETFLVDLGVKLVRFRIYEHAGDSGGSNAFMRRMWTDHGIRWHATAGAYDPGDTEGARRAAEVLLESQILLAAPGLEGLGGYNEPNGTRIGPIDPSWPTYCATHNHWMKDLKTANPSTLGSVIICGPSLHDHPPGGDTQLQADYASCSVVAPYMEQIEMHRYPSGGVPSAGIDQRTGWAVAGVGNKLPVIVSETGYNITPSGWAQAVSTTAQNIYTPRTLAEHVQRGNKCIHFELLNQYDDGTPSYDKENWHGLVSAPTADVNDQTPLPVFNSMKRMLAHFEDGDSAYTAHPLSVTYGGNPGVQTVLTQKRDGTYRLMIWRDVKVWDQANDQDLSVQPVNFNLLFPAPRTITYYTPSVNATGTNVTGTTCTVPVAGHLMVVKI